MKLELSLKEWEDLEKSLLEALGYERWQHSLGVAYTASALAMYYGLDVQRARLAGLLHDCAKNVPKDKRISECEKAGIELNEFEIKNTTLIHAKLGAYLAKKKYGVTDPEILSSIRYHTTGRAAMSLLEQIIYVADYIEPNRDEELKDLEEIREAAFKDMDRCCYLVAERTIGHLKTKNKDIDPMSEEVFEYYRDRCEER